MTAQLAVPAGMRRSIEQGIARGWSAAVIAVEVGVPVDAVHEVWDVVDALAGVPDVAEDESPAPEPVTWHTDRAGWLADFSALVVDVGPERACIEQGVSISAAEQRYVRYRPGDPVARVLMAERARQARLLRHLAKAREQGLVAA